MKQQNDCSHLSGFPFQSSGRQRDQRLPGESSGKRPSPQHTIHHHQVLITTFNIVTQLTFAISLWSTFRKVETHLNRHNFSTSAIVETHSKFRGEFLSRRKKAHTATRHQPASRHLDTSSISIGGWRIGVTCYIIHTVTTPTIDYGRHAELHQLPVLGQAQKASEYVFSRGQHGVQH